MPDSQNRLDLARRLHDGLAQDLAVLGYSLDEVIGDPRLTQDLRDRLREIRIGFADVTRDFRDELYRIRLMDRNSLQGALSELLASIPHEIDLGYPELSIAAEDAVSHSLLEIARNVLQHSRATHFKITWRIEEHRLIIEASDNGVGGVSYKERSFGIRGIREWLVPIKGDLTLLDSATGTHFCIQIDSIG